MPIVTIHSYFKIVYYVTIAVLVADEENNKSFKVTYRSLIDDRNKTKDLTNDMLFEIYYLFYLAYDTKEN